MTDYEPKSLEGIPESGVARLEQNREGLYTSDLTVNEFMLITEAGFDPVGLVVGQFDLPHRDPDRRADQEPRAGHALAGHV